MRPQRGTLVCIRCTHSGKARTVLSQGRRIHLSKGQQGLGGLQASATPGVEPTLEPQTPTWKPQRSHGTVHPQLGLFPYDTIREGQKRFTRDVTMAVQGGKHLIAQAPTGIGKTAAALAPALHYALEHKKTVMFLTSRKSQHRIAVETLRRITELRGAKFGLVDLVAKRDMCLRPEARDMHGGRFADFCGNETRHKACQYLGVPDKDTLQRVSDGVLHVEELMAVSKSASLCPHIVALAAAKEAQVVVADYNHLFSDIRDQSLDRLGLTLGNLIVIVDEAHNLPDRIRASHSHRITPYLLDQVEAEARREKAHNVENDVQAFRKCLVVLAELAVKENLAQPARLGGSEEQVARLQVEHLGQAFESVRGTFFSKRSLGDAAEELAKLVIKLRKTGDQVIHAEELHDAIEDWGRFRNGALRYLRWGQGSPELHIRLLDPAVPAAKVFQAIHSAILMSGTLRPPEMIRDMLGLVPERSLVRNYPSPYPPENRPIFVQSGYSIRFTERSPALWRRVADDLAQVCKAAKGNVACFAPSYAILREVQAALDGRGKKLVIIEDASWTKGERDQVLDDLEGARKPGGPGGALLLGVLGGSFAEGVDYANNLLSAVVVIGLPLAPPDLEVEAAIDHMERKMPGRGRAYAYIHPAMNKVLQALGRGIRSSSDKCAIVLLDSRFLGPPFRGLLPDDAIVSVTTEPAEAAGRFLAMHRL